MARYVDTHPGDSGDAGVLGDAGTSARQYQAIVGRGDYFAACRVPNASRVVICAAVQHGVAAGVSVRLEPDDREVAECVAHAVRGLGFPGSTKMDVTRTTFEPAD